MTSGLLAPAVQVCAFALGCALIHAAREHADVMTRWLTGAMLIAGGLVLIAATAICAPDDQARFDEVTVYAALAIHPTANE